MKKLVILSVIFLSATALYALNLKRQGDEMAVAGYLSGAQAKYEMCMELEPAARIRANPTSLQFVAAGGTETINVSKYRSAPTATTSQTWLSISQSGASFSVVCEPNTTTSSRSGTITIRSGTRETTVSVQQDAAEHVVATPTTATYLTASPNSLSFAAAGETRQITVSTDGSTYRATASQSWITVTTSGNTVRVVCSANTSTSARSGTITITSDSRTAIVNVTQAAANYQSDAAGDANTRAYQPNYLINN